MLLVQFSEIVRREVRNLVQKDHSSRVEGRAHLVRVYTAAINREALTRTSTNTRGNHVSRAFLTMQPCYNNHKYNAIVAPPPHTHLG